MATVEAIVKFFAAYTTGAKLLMLAGIMLTIGTLLIARRAPAGPSPDPGNAAPKPAHAVLRLRGVTSLRLPPGSAVRVTAYVNGEAFVYPSRAGVEWLEVGPTMGSQSFQIPHAEQYVIRFEMDRMTAEPAGASRYVSQEEVRVDQLPHSADYTLYPVVNQTRDRRPAALVLYSVMESP